MRRILTMYKAKVEYDFGSVPVTSKYYPSLALRMLLKFEMDEGRTYGKVQGELIDKDLFGTDAVFTWKWLNKPRLKLTQKQIREMMHNQACFGSAMSAAVGIPNTIAGAARLDLFSNRQQQQASEYPLRKSPGSSWQPLEPPDFSDNPADFLKLVAAIGFVALILGLIAAWFITYIY